MSEERRTLHRLANLLTVAAGALERGRGFPGLGHDEADAIEPERERALADSADALREASNVLRRRLTELAAAQQGEREGS